MRSLSVRQAVYLALPGFGFGIPDRASITRMKPMVLPNDSCLASVVKKMLPSSLPSGRGFLPVDLGLATEIMIAFGFDQYFQPHRDI